MCGPALPIIGAIAALGSAGASIYSGIKGNQNQKSAIAQSEKTAAATQAANERAINRANQKTPSIAGLTASNILGNSSGVGSTMLTGAAGSKLVSPAMLGKSTLLGG
jgi:hypothetical protein